MFVRFITNVTSDGFVRDKKKHCDPEQTPSYPESETSLLPGDLVEEREGDNPRPST